MALKVNRISISDILGIEQLSFETPNSMVTFEGQNETGKTSALRAIRAALGGGKVGTILRDGAEAGEVVIEFSDQTEVTARVKRKADGSSSAPSKTVKHPTFGTIPAPVDHLSKLVDVMALNPVKLVMADEKDLIDLVLEILPVTVTDEQLAAAGVSTMPPPAKNGLDRIAAAGKLVYDDRTGLNRIVKERRAAASQLVATLPTQAPERPALALLRANQTDLQEAKAAELKAVSREAETHRKTIAAALEADIQKLRDAAKVRTDEFDRAERAQLNEVAERYGKRLEEAAALIATAEEQAKRADTDETTRKLVTQYQAEAADAEAASKARTATLEKLEAMKAQVLETFPLANVRIADGHFLVEDIAGRFVAWPDVNQARKVETILSILALRAGELRLVCMDGLECLDEETFKALEEQLSGPDAPIQLMGGRVTDAPALEVRGGVRTAAPVQAATDQASGVQEAPAAEPAPFPFRAFKTDGKAKEPARKPLF